MEQKLKKAKNLIKRKNYSEAFGLLRSAEKEGDPIASYALGTWYLHGTHVKKDLQKGVQYLIRASKGNLKEAFYDLAVCYEKGAGTEKNLQKAFQNYLIASRLGDKDALYQVVRCLYYGIGVPKNKELSLLIYTKFFDSDKNSKMSKPINGNEKIKKVNKLAFA